MISLITVVLHKVYTLAYCSSTEVCTDQILSLYLTSKFRCQPARFLHFTVQYLFAILSQDVIELSHQMLVDGLSGADVFELLKHVEGSG